MINSLQSIRDELKVFAKEREATAMIHEVAEEIAITRAFNGTNKEQAIRVGKAIIGALIKVRGRMP